MKSTLITLGFLLATSQARTLKSLLQTDDLGISQNPVDFGFAPNCSYNFPSLPGGTGTGTGTGNPSVCSCTVSGTTGAGLPALGQATYTTNTNALNAAVG